MKSFIFHRCMGAHNTHSSMIRKYQSENYLLFQFFYLLSIYLPDIAICCYLVVQHIWNWILFVIFICVSFCCYRRRFVVNFYHSANGPLKYFPMIFLMVKDLICILKPQNFVKCFYILCELFISNKS